MKTFGHVIGLAIVLASATSLVWAQKATYDPFTGIMHVDSGDIDLVAVFIEGPDVSAGQGCNLCDGMNLPAEDPAGFDASTWTLGFINGSSQWIRTNPLQGRGFVGTIADSFIDGMGNEQPWPEDFPPFLDFPDLGGGIANYGPGLNSSDFGLVTFASDDGSTTTGSVGGCLGCSFPTANDDEYTTRLGSVLDVPAPGLLLNDEDESGYGLTASLATDPIFGDVTVNSDGSFTYTAPPLGSLSPGTVDTFTYLAIDNSYDTDEATVSITLVPEPSLSLLMVALVGIWVRRVRQDF
ncbi:MAG: Ig-like domain-containing protein [Planctomycetota bacterium]